MSNIEDNVESYLFADTYIMVYKQAIKPHICTGLIEDIEKREWSTHSWNHYSAQNSISYADKELDVIHGDKDHMKKISGPISKCLKEYQEKVKSKFITGFSDIRFNRYTVGTLIRSHYDHIPMDNGHGIPILSIVANLNEGYEGADFIIRNNIIPLKTGDVVLFPSNFIYPHKVSECEYGTRYSFVSWAY